MRLILFSCLFLSLLFQESAHAYIDPGTGAIILQALAAAGVAILVFGKRIYYGIRGMLRKSEATNSDAEGMEK